MAANAEGSQVVRLVRPSAASEYRSVPRSINSAQPASPRTA